ncbi:terminase small subunit [Pseudoduganella sp. RAF19]|uniref:terminase small subunit n=2 Tax=unclassified Pseudoduganella TaxID=2637179 RepID=UPI003F9E17FD
MVDLTSPMKQAEFGDLVGVSQQAVSDLVKREVLIAGEPAGMWLQRYCAHLREHAAGRAAAGDLDLATERAALAREQRIRLEMANALTRKESAPVATLEMAMATMGRKIARVLESIPVSIKRRSPGLTAADFEIITTEIAKARNIAASAQLEDEDEDGSIGDSEGDQEWPEDA